MPTKYNVNTPAETIVQDNAARIADKVVLTTGVSPGGLGSWFVEQISVAKPKLLILASRSTAKLEATAATIASKSAVPTRLLELDLSSQDSVRKAAATVLAWDDVPVIDILMNNAGIMATPYGKTVDGFERQFGTNHLGPFVFTNLLMEKVLKAKEPRVILVSSDGHRLSPVRFDDLGFDNGKTYDMWRAYGQSKTANMLMAVSLAEKLGPKGLTAVSLHPGVVGTKLGDALDWNLEAQGLQALDRQLGFPQGWLKEFSWKGPSEGVATHVYAAFDEDVKLWNGAHASDSHRADPRLGDTLRCWGTDSSEAQMLWELSEKLVGQEFSY